MRQASIEKLPTELLESIFLHCLNGNLLLASPRIASRLSNNESLYKTAFAISFHGHQLKEVLDHLELAFIASQLPNHVPIWSTRSITKAVLRARWCTNQWAVAFSRALLRGAMGQLSRRLDVNKYVREVIEKFQLEEASNRPCWHISAEIAQGRQVATLDCSYPLGMEFLRGEDDYPIFFADDTDDDNTITVFQFDMTFCGAASERHERFTSADCRELTPDETPFREFINSIIFGLMPETGKGEDPDGFWSNLNSIYEEPMQEYEEYHRWSWRHTFRQRVAVDYLLSSESTPFRIPPHIFHQAAAHFLENYYDHDEYRGGLEIYAPVYIHYLFEIDPTSMPRNDPTILRWASRACERIRHFGYAYEKYRAENQESEADLVADAWHRRYAYQQKVLARYTFEVEVRMVRYLKTGEPPYPPDCPAPHLHNPILETEKHCSSDYDYVPEDDESDVEEDEYLSGEAYEAAAQKHRDRIRKGPNPPDLDFLDDDDYRRQESTEDACGSAVIEGSEHASESGAFENGSFSTQILDSSPLGYELDNISMDLRRNNKLYWWSGNDCELPASLVQHIKWYKRPRRE